MDRGGKDVAMIICSREVLFGQTASSVRHIEQQQLNFHFTKIPSGKFATSENALSTCEAKKPILLVNYDICIEEMLACGHPTT